MHLLIAGKAGPTIPISRAPINTPTKSSANILFLSELFMVIVVFFLLISFHLLFLRYEIVNHEIINVYTNKNYSKKKEYRFT